jgi:uroporphyrinogen decarboxylase
MEKLTFAIIEYLKLQIASGVHAVQIFDSCGGLLAGQDFEAGSARWMREIVTALDGKVPVIIFAKDAHGDWPALINTGANVLGFDWTLNLPTSAALLPANIAVQGNLDPALLATQPDIVARETARLLKSMAGRPGYIFNLGHGVPPDAKLECIQTLVDTVKEFAQ